MADYFSGECRFCGYCVFYLVEGPEADEAKMQRLHCYKCESKDLETEPVNEAFYEKYPDLPRIREDGPLYPLKQIPEFMN